MPPSSFEGRREHAMVYIYLLPINASGKQTIGYNYTIDCLTCEG